MLFALLLIVAGVLAAASLIVQKQPNAREIIAKLVPFQGIIGIILLLWGLINLIRLLSVLGPMMQGVPLTAILALATFLVAVALGFLLGYGLIKQYVLNKDGGASQGGENLLLRLAKVQGPLGIIGIGLGIWMLISFLGTGF
ncbi:MAG TPA: hypothetical protein VF723_05020 [Pyrinomonadaceae bacterium]|jgi:hypothetical protein